MLLGCFIENQHNARPELKQFLNVFKELQDKLSEIEKTSGGWLEPAACFVTTCNAAGSVAWQGSLTAKRDFLKKIGSNLTLKDRSLKFTRGYPYDIVAKISPSKNWLLPPEDSNLQDKPISEF